MRANVAKSLGLVRSGASSGLATMVTNTDPEFSNMKNVCHFWRRFFRYFPQWKNNCTCIPIPTRTMQERTNGMLEENIFGCKMDNH